MLHRDWRFRIEDILEAISRIQSYTAGLTFEGFCQDKRTIDAAPRNFEVMGEAARHIPQEDESAAPDIPWNQSRAMRNGLIHSYFGVNLTIVWDTIQHDFPPLIPLLQQVVDMKGEG